MGEVGFRRRGPYGKSKRCAQGEQARLRCFCPEPKSTVRPLEEIGGERYKPEGR